MSSPDNPDDAERLLGFADALADAVERALPGWVARAVARRAGGADVDGDAVAQAGQRAAADVGAAVRDVLRADVDHQRGNPLAVLRGAVRYPTEVLRAHDVTPVPRDEFAVRAFPEDVYDLSPATWADVSEDLHEPGIMWGAAKAHVVLARRRRERGEQ